MRAETFDAIASIGMVEHVGEKQIDTYAAPLRALLKPGGRLLNHGITRAAPRRRGGGPRSRSATCSRTRRRSTSSRLLALERTGFPAATSRASRPTTRDAAGVGERLVETLERARELAGEERVRVWRLYLRASRQGFERGFIGVYQVRAALPGDRAGPGGRAEQRHGRRLGERYSPAMLQISHHERVEGHPHRWHVFVHGRDEPIPVELSADDRRTLDLTDEEIHERLPSALERGAPLHREPRRPAHGSGRAVQRGELGRPGAPPAESLRLTGRPP